MQEGPGAQGIEFAEDVVEQQHRCGSQAQRWPVRAPRAGGRGRASAAPPGRRGSATADRPGSARARPGGARPSTPHVGRPGPEPRAGPRAGVRTRNAGRPVRSRSAHRPAGRSGAPPAVPAARPAAPAPRPVAMPDSSSRASQTSRVTAASGRSVRPAVRSSALRCRSTLSTSSADRAALGSTTARVSSRKRRRSDGPARTTPMSSGENTVTRSASWRSPRRRTAWRLTCVRERPVADTSASMVSVRSSTRVSARRMARSVPRRTSASFGEPRNDCSVAR